MKRSALTRREFLKLVGAGSATLAVGDSLGLVSSAAAEIAAGEHRRPNVVLILADDLGYGELGCQGNKEIPTPNIDSIARNGIRFTDGYVSCPVCSPTRAGLMTGRYQQRFGHEFNPGPRPSPNFGLPLPEMTLASRMKSAGYVTSMVGKWHLGFREKYRPLDRGFDEFYGFLDGSHPYFHDVPPNQQPIFRGNETIEEKEYLTDAFAREALAFLDRQHEKPFFLYLPFNAVHSPLQATDKYLDRFPEIKDEKRRTFAGMLSAMDEAVGKVLESLRKKELEEDTLIFFVSDNGGPTKQTTSRNDPLRGFKGQVYEGGIRVPFMVQWKGHLPSGQVYSKPVISLDISPTILAAARVKAKDAKFDGVNLIPYISGKSDRLPHDALYWRYGAQCAIREGNWKLLKPKAETTELYDLAADIGEKDNLAVRNPKQFKDLNKSLEEWNSQLMKPLW